MIAAKSSASPLWEPEELRDDPVVRIRLLGEFQIEVDGHPIPSSAWRLTKARSLVQLLALAPGHELHREQVMEILWPGADSRATAGNYRQVIHAARRALHVARIEASASPSILDVRGGTISLNPAASLWIDVDEFNRLIAKGRQTRDYAMLESAADLYTGDLLPADPYGDWFEERRIALRGAAVALLVELAAERERRGEYEHAVVLLQRVLELDIAHEASHASLMRLYAIAGEPANASRQFRILSDVLSKHLDAEPSTSTAQLHKDILVGRIGHDVRHPGQLAISSLPVPLTSFVGRDSEIEAVDALLENHRLVTLTGAGGSGKSRLALAIAERVERRFTDNVAFVELATVSQAQLVARAVLASLGAREGNYRSLSDALVVALRDHPTLLILDSCEHLIEPCAALVRDLLVRCPRLRILATSRERLHIEGEVIWRVPPLSLPDPDLPLTRERVLKSEAAQLFSERATRRRPDFVLKDRDLGAIVDITRRLDGLPLAIELAAARIDVLTPRELAARLHDALRLSDPSSQAAPPRHQTLRATLDWSYALLSEPEQRALCGLAVFSGGWSLDAAEAVLVDDEIARQDVLGLLARLSERSLVHAEYEEVGTRYRLLETVRQYALELHSSRVDEEAIRRRHVDYFVTLADAAEPALRGSEQATWLVRLDLEIDNIRSALEWSQRQGMVEAGLRICWGMWRFWSARGYFDEGRKWMDEFLSHSSQEYEVQARVRVLFAAARFAMLQSDDARAVELADECQETAIQIGDQDNLSGALTVLGHVHLRHGELDQSRGAYQGALSVRREQGDEWGVAISLMSLARVAHAAGDHRDAIDQFASARSIFLKQGDAENAALSLLRRASVSLDLCEWELAEPLLQDAQAELHAVGSRLYANECLIYLARVRIERDDRVGARTLLAQALETANQLGSARDVTSALEGFALLFAKGRSARDAIELAAAVDTLRNETRESPIGDERQRLEIELAAVRDRLDPIEQRAALARGALMGLDRAVNFALSIDADDGSESSA